MVMQATNPGRRGQLERFTEDQQMLTLSLSSYRGFAYFTPVVMRRRDLRRSITEALSTLPSLHRRFQLLWGPATFRAPLTALDDAAMFVVADVDQADRYVVVIRGTNPVSAFDWVFGDFWTARAIPWDQKRQQAPGDARVSLSTALGLAVLRLMRAPTDDSWLGEAAWRVISEDVSDPLRRAAGKPMKALSLSASLLARLSPVLRGRLGRVEHSLRVLPSDPEDRIRRLARAWNAPAVQSALRRVDAVLEAPVEDVHLALLRLLTGTARIRSLLAPGRDLAGLLSTLTAEADGAVQIDVVGHSKGGALASALALWLAETKGETWDPSGRAEVRCFSFAGPTAGNRAFAGRIDEVLGARHRRVANSLDIVPHAWAFRDHAGGDDPCVDDIADLYPPPVQQIGALEELASVVRDQVAHLDYGHTRANVHDFAGQIAPDHKPWLAQVSHQHLDAYVLGMGLEGTLDARWFFQLG